MATGSKMTTADIATFNANFLICPAEAKPYPDMRRDYTMNMCLSSVNFLPGTSYGVRTNPRATGGGNYNNSFGCVQIDEIDEPTKVFLTIDAYRQDMGSQNGAYTGAYSAWMSWENIRWRHFATTEYGPYAYSGAPQHDGRANILFVDGHVANAAAQADARNGGVSNGIATGGFQFW